MAQKQEITKVHTRQGKHKTGIVTAGNLNKKNTHSKIQYLPKSSLIMADYN